MINTLLDVAITIWLFSIPGAFIFAYLWSQRFRRAMHVVAYVPTALGVEVGQSISYEDSDGSEQKGAVIEIGYQGYEVKTLANGIRFIRLAEVQPLWRFRFVESNTNPFTDS